MSKPIDYNPNLGYKDDVIREKYPATAQDKKFKKPVAHNPNEDRLPAKRKSKKS